MTIFVVGGGTGGHLFPALSIGREIIKRGKSVVLVTDTRCFSYLSNNNDIKTYVLHMGFVRPGALSKICLVIRILIATIKSLFFLKKHNASMVVGFGGYTAFPTLLAAKILSIPIALHEQNCFFGKVNRFFAKSASIIALTSANTAHVPSEYFDKIIVTGNPVRPEMKDINAENRQFCKNNSLSLFVTGGSQGAAIFSEIIPSAVAFISKNLPHLKISIKQQAKKEDHDRISGIYKENNISSELSEFFLDIKRCYLSSDIVICRSGASTISELIYLGQPAILVPYPLAAENHQYFNALDLCNKSSAWLIEQKDLTSISLARYIMKIMQDTSCLDLISKNLLNLRNNSERIIVDTLLNIID